MLKIKNLNHKDQFKQALCVIVDLAERDLQVGEVRTGAEVVAYLKKRHGLVRWRNLHVRGLKCAYSVAMQSRRACNRDLIDHRRSDGTSAIQTLPKP